MATPATARRLTPRVDSRRLEALARRVRVADPASTQDVTNAMTGARSTHPRAA